MNTEMTAKFSASVLAFYPQNMIDDGSYGDSLPGDLIELTAPELAEYWKQTPPTGKILGSKKGRPMWVDAPAPTKEELIYQAESRKQVLIAEATIVIAPLQDAVDLGMATPEEESALKEWKEYRVLLSRVDTSLGADVVWPTPPASLAR